MERDDSYYINKIRESSNFYKYDEELLKELIHDLRERKLLCLLDDNFFELLSMLPQFDAINLIEVTLMPDKIHNRDIRMFYHINEQLAELFTSPFSERRNCIKLYGLLNSVCYHIKTIHDIVTVFEENIEIQARAKYGLELKFAIMALTIYYVYFTDNDNIDELYDLFNKCLNNSNDYYDYLHMNGVRTVYTNDSNNKEKYYKCLDDAH